MGEIKRFNEWVLASAYLFDTSFLVHLIIEGQTFHSQSAAFFDRLARETGSRRYLLSPVLYAEFANTVARLFLIDRHGMSAADAQKHLRDEGPVKVASEVREALDRLDQALDLLGDDVFQVRLDFDLWQRAIEVMFASSLQPYDAIHVASAFYARCTDIVSFDKGFNRVAGLTIWRP